MLVDEVKVVFKAGTGGNGKVAFRREKYVEFGGPAGGNGGNGGSVVIIGDSALNNLLWFKNNNLIKAQGGQNGAEKSCNGKNGENTVVRVPLGTQVWVDGQLLFEVLTDRDEFIVAHGGRGGRGNKSFKSNRNQAPDYAENGLPGEEVSAKLILKYIADIGLVGFPNVGKSSTLALISRANPKIADYEFTTLIPNLGVVSTKEKDFVVCDIPGIIENAHLGEGLGFTFLRHIERCKVLAHVLDLTKDPKSAYLQIKSELKKYSKQLVKKKELIILNKADLVDQATIDAALKCFKNKPKVVISTKNYIDSSKVIAKMDLVLSRVRPLQEPVYTQTQTELKPKNDKTQNNLFTVKREENCFVIEGKMIFDLFYKVDFNNDSSVKRFAYQLRSLGVDEALLEHGAKNGDVVRIKDFYFDFIV